MKRVNHRYQGGLWAALFLILLLPLLFIKSGIGHPLFNLPVRRLSGSLPRARLVWEYYGKDNHIPCWLGGKLVTQQQITADASGTLVAVDADGTTLWKEEITDPFTAASDGRQLILAPKNGQVMKVVPDRGVLWSEATGWETQFLVLSAEGMIALAQGPIVEEQANLLERVRFYSDEGEFLVEHAFRNNSIIRMAFKPARLAVSSINLAGEMPQGQVFDLAPDSTDCKLLWKDREIVHALAVGNSKMAAAAEDKIFLVDQSGKSHIIKLGQRVADLAWAGDEKLAVAKGGDLPSAAGQVVLISTDGEQKWQQRLKGACRFLVAREDEILAADANIVYSYSIRGDLNWCYESPAIIKGLYPQVKDPKVVVASGENHLQLIEPP